MDTVDVRMLITIGYKLFSILVPITFDDYEPTDDRIDWAIDPSSNAYTILAFLGEHPGTGFSPKEIHEATDLPRGSIGTTLSRLEERGLVRHKEPYWAIDRQGIATYEAVLTSLETVEGVTTYDWDDHDPSDYRIGLDAVSQTDENDGD